ncbi:hypothetical protein SO802_005956 [Lithocarpus litseifolius]|uniref:Uncharacterized protein n=1 Tax=Lithocarpus litseifolius TaxID=425828 RepID=A0AAW2DJM3_9ROSI
MDPRLRNSKGTNLPPTLSKPVGENEVVARQRNEREEPDPMVRMVEMMKDLQQEIRQLKEGKTQEIKENVPLLANEEKPQPEGGSVMGGGANPQYLTLVEVNALLEQETKKHSGIPKSLFNQLGFGPEARRIVTESFMSIVVDTGVECFTIKSHASRAFLETTNTITFTDEDLEVEYPEHQKPLHLTATINGVQIKRELVDIRALLNLISLSTLETVGMSGKRILGWK